MNTIVLTISFLCLSNSTSVSGYLAGQDKVVQYNHRPMQDANKSTEKKDGDSDLLEPLSL